MGKLSRFLLAVALSIPLIATGCAARRQVYTWGPGETTYYAQWERDTHHDHVEWEQRNSADQAAYWKWRKHHQ